MDAVLGVVIVLGLLAVVGWVALWSARRDGPAPVGSNPTPREEAVQIAIGVERAEGVAEPGRHDERRCAY
jgi:hypothetical protein